MKSGIAREYLMQETMIEDPWSEAILYQPYEAEQILLAENASCLAVKTFLKMCNLPFTVQSFKNAEFMSPGGRMTKLPFIKTGAFVVSEFEPIVSMAETKGISLSNEMDDDLRSDIRAYISLTENIFTNAELYISWVDKNVLEKVTYPRYGSVYPWPLNHYQNWKKRNAILKQLAIYEWKDMTIYDVVGRVHKCCEALSEKLDKNEFFYGNKPNELDCLVFGHIFTICTYPFLEEKNWLHEILEKFPNLLIHAQRIFNEFFQDDFRNNSRSNEKFKKLKILTDFLGGKKSIFYSNFFEVKIVNTTALSFIKCVLKEDLVDLSKRNKRSRKNKIFKELKSLGVVEFKKF